MENNYMDAFYEVMLTYGKWKQIGVNEWTMDVKKEILDRELKNRFPKEHEEYMLLKTGFKTENNDR